MSVRNFWLSATADGRTTAEKLGPRTKDGGIDARIYIRDDGDAIEALQVRGRADGDDLHLVVEDCRTGEIVHEIRSHR